MLSENFEDRTKFFRESLKKILLAANAAPLPPIFWDRRTAADEMTSAHGSTSDLADILQLCGVSSQKLTYSTHAGYAANCFIYRVVHARSTCKNRNKLRIA